MCRVLVVDDEEGVLQAIVRRLERHGFQVFPASTAEDGIRLIHGSEKPFDVIVTDMSIENADSGLNVLAAAFTRDMFAAVIVMTAYGNVANAVECMRRGAFDYLEKNTPAVDVYEMLTAKVDQALERRRQDIRTIEKWNQSSRPPA